MTLFFFFDSLRQEAAEDGEVDDQVEVEVWLEEILDLAVSGFFLLRQPFVCESVWCVTWSHAEHNSAGSCGERGVRRGVRNLMCLCILGLQDPPADKSDGLKDCQVRVLVGDDFAGRS